MKVVIEYEKPQGCQVEDVHERNLDYNVISLDVASGELRLVDAKGLAAETCPIPPLTQQGGRWPRTAGTATGSTW